MLKTKQHKPHRTNTSNFDTNPTRGSSEKLKQVFLFNISIKAFRQLEL